MSGSFGFVGGGSRRRRYKKFGRGDRIGGAGGFLHVRKLLFQHDFEDSLVGLDHAVCGEGADVSHGVFGGIADDTVCGVHIDALE